MKDYEVGQILYLTNENSFKIIPVQVVEEVVRTTISGKLKTYLIQFPDKNKTIADIEEIKYNFFKTEKDVKTYLLENTRIAIDKLLFSANELKNDAFGIVNSDPEHSQPDEISESKVVQQDSEKDIITVDLGDGKTGRLKVENLIKATNK